MPTPEQPVTPSEVLPRAVPRSAEDLDALAAEIRAAEPVQPGLAGTPGARSTL